MAALSAPILAVRVKACITAVSFPNPSSFSATEALGPSQTPECSAVRGVKGNSGTCKVHTFCSEPASSLSSSSNLGGFAPRCRLQHHKLKFRNVRMHLEIDRRHYFDESLRRQKEAEDREAEAEITCPVDCVREVRTHAEFERVLHEAELTNTLVVVDFYNSSCGSCKYILPQFIKLCKRGFGEEVPAEDAGERGVQFIKHNVRDDYDDLTDLARFYSIRTVPMFSFFVDGSRVEQFPTRDRRKLEQCVQRLMVQLSS